MRENYWLGERQRQRHRKAPKPKAPKCSPKYPCPSNSTVFKNFFKKKKEFIRIKIKNSIPQKRIVSFCHLISPPVHCYAVVLSSSYSLSHRIPDPTRILLHQNRSSTLTALINSHPSLKSVSHFPISLLFRYSCFFKFQFFFFIFVATVIFYFEYSSS